MSNRTITLHVACSNSAAAICQRFLADEIQRDGVRVTGDPGLWPRLICVRPLTREETTGLTALLTKQNIYWHIEKR